jgi:AcrR family transcriptional regulator
LARSAGRSGVQPVTRSTIPNVADVLPIRSGDPRIDRTRRAVLDAVGLLVATEGAGSITHLRVAEVSGVGRATLYRHWPTPADLLYDLLNEADQPLLRLRDEPIMDWLRAELRRSAFELSQPTAIQFLMVLVGRADFDPGAAELRRRIHDETVMNLARAVARAAARGELCAEPDPHELCAQLLGPILLRTMIEGRNASDKFVDDTINVVMAPWLPSRP